MLRVKPIKNWKIKVSVALVIVIGALMIWVQIDLKEYQASHPLPTSNENEWYETSSEYRNEFVGTVFTNYFGWKGLTPSAVLGAWNKGMIHHSHRAIIQMSSSDFSALKTQIISKQTASPGGKQTYGISDPLVREASDPSAWNPPTGQTFYFGIMPDSSTENGDRLMGNYYLVYDPNKQLLYLQSDNL